MAVAVVGAAAACAAEAAEDFLAERGLAAEEAMAAAGIVAGVTAAEATAELAQVRPISAADNGPHRGDRKPRPELGWRIAAALTLAPLVNARTGARLAESSAAPALAPRAIAIPRRVVINSAVSSDYRPTKGCRDEEPLRIARPANFPLATAAPST